MRINDAGYEGSAYFDKYYALTNGQKVVKFDKHLVLVSLISAVCVQGSVPTLWPTEAQRTHEELLDRI